MDQKAVFNYCKHLGCCEACCLRYIGIKNPKAYEDLNNYFSKNEDEVNTELINTTKHRVSHTNSTDTEEKIVTNTNKHDIKENIYDNSLDTTENTISCNKTPNSERNDVIAKNDSPPSKKLRLDICVSCLGLLQEDNWKECFDMVKEMLVEKGYGCSTFACALSSPVAILLRERVVTLRLAEQFSDYDSNILIALKEAWKWSFGIALASEIDKTLDSGAVSPLLITIHYDYADDLHEMQALKQVSPNVFEERSKQKRRCGGEFSRRSVELTLETVNVESVRWAGAVPGVRARCAAVSSAHAPAYLAGRYIKLSRNLPQTPWILGGKRMLPSSVQEIIYRPLATFYKLDAEEADRRLKLIAAGREDVDVRCLGEGRPFAIEITDPTRVLSSEELSQACEEISKSGEVIVKRIVPITKEDLVQLKKGEETKSKTYEALCIKLSHSKYDHVLPDAPIQVTPEDIARINSFRNSSGDKGTISEISQNVPNEQKNNTKDNQMVDDTEDGVKDATENTLSTSVDGRDTAVDPVDPEHVQVTIKQKTPIRVLHRRPLLTRTRQILQLKAVALPENPGLFGLRVRTSAGTYVKEWVHGEFGRSTPALGDALGAAVDLLALDVTAVHLDWPPVQ